MFSVVQSSSAVPDTLEALPNVSQSNSVSLSYLDPSPKSGFYEIEDARQSECTLVLFSRHLLTSNSFVMKILKEYKDTRYSLETLHNRQQCQLEALRQNREFTPEIYIGLARVDALNLDQKSIYIDEIIKDPSQEMLDPGAEYTLIMHPLPENRRLDYLLQEKEDPSLLGHIRLLTKHVAYIHNRHVDSSLKEETVQWGSYEQLQRKLLHNFGLLDLVLLATKNDRYRVYDWTKETIDRMEWTIDWLKRMLLNAFKQNHYHYYFQQRREGQHIRHCHGDLKSQNIWILPYDHCCAEQPEKLVKILDAIDFNPEYSNIDTLSDFAMLVVDIQTRTQSAELVNEMIRYYLELTDQDNEIARSVLNYYLVEKAIVGSAISITYDNLPALGLSLLDVAETHLNRLVLS
jgi:aminoglycoside phosphotransferase family enzyme